MPLRLKGSDPFGEIKVLDLDLEVDLQDFSRYLWQQGIRHRIAEQSGRQVLWVEQPAHVVPVEQLYRQFASGVLQLRRVAPVTQVTPDYGRRLAGLLADYPLTLIVIVLSLLGTALVWYDSRQVLLHYFTFTGYQWQLGNRLFLPVDATLANGEYWRLLTPAFLHFGLLHATFNLLWFWELGRRIEQRQGGWHFLGLVLFTGMGGNIAQYLFSPTTLFGGLSGVVYGLVGYCWIWAKLTGDRTLMIHRTVLSFMLIMLFVFMTGITEPLGLGAVANAAHFFGLVFGMGMAAASAVVSGEINSKPRSDRR